MGNTLALINPYKLNQNLILELENASIVLYKNL
jgi:hypothetical protein